MLAPAGSCGGGDGATLRSQNCASRGRDTRTSYTHICMYIYIYIYMYIYVYTHIHLYHIYIYIHNAYVCVMLYVHKDAYMCT